MNETFSLIQIPEPDGNFSLLGDRHNRSVCEPIGKSSKSTVCEMEALQLSCENRTPVGRRLTLHQKSSSESSLTAVERCCSSGDAVRYSCLELQPVRLFDDTDSSQLDRLLLAPDTSANSTTNDKFVVVDKSVESGHRKDDCHSLGSDVSVARSVSLVQSKVKVESKNVSHDERLLHTTCRDVVIQR